MIGCRIAIGRGEFGRGLPKSVVGGDNIECVDVFSRCAGGLECRRHQQCAELLTPRHYLVEDPGRKLGKSSELPCHGLELLKDHGDLSNHGGTASGLRQQCVRCLVMTSLQLVDQ